MDRRCTSRIVRRVARHAAVDKPIGRHTLRRAFITAALDAGVSLRDVQEPPPMPTRAPPPIRDDRGRLSPDRHATSIVTTYLAAR